MTTTEADGASEGARELVEALERTSDSMGVFRTSQDAERFEVIYEELDEARDALLSYIASLEAENDRLREAAQELVGSLDDPFTLVGPSAERAADELRQALDSEEDG